MVWSVFTVSLHPTHHNHIQSSASVLCNYHHSTGSMCHNCTWTTKFPWEQTDSLPVLSTLHLSENFNWAVRFSVFLFSITQHRWDTLCDSGTIYKCLNLLTYLLTYSIQCWQVNCLSSPLKHTNLHRRCAEFNFARLLCKWKHVFIWVDLRETFHFVEEVSIIQDVYSFFINCRETTSSTHSHDHTVWHTFNC